MLLLAQHQIDNPAGADVNARFAAVGEDVGMVATSVFEGIRQDWQNHIVPRVQGSAEGGDGVGSQAVMLRSLRLW